MRITEFFEKLNPLFSKEETGLRYYEDETHNGVISDENGNCLNTFPVLVYEERHLLLNDSESYMYLAIRSYGKTTDVVRIKSNALFNKNTYVSMFGNKPFAEFDERSWSIFFKLIKTMLPEIEQKVVYEYFGWNNDLDRYLFGNLLIDADNVLPIQTTFVKTKTLLSEKSNKDICECISDIVKNISNNEIIGNICIMYLLLSHIKQRFVVKFRVCPEFVLSIVGATGSYKTTTATALFNTYNGSVSSFEDTFASIRRDVQSNKSGTIIIDDYKISSSSNDAKYEKIIRLSGDVQTSGKYVSGNKVVDKSITGMSVITGEKRPQLQQSSYSRILFADLGEFPINVSYLTKLQQCKSDINSFIVLFVRYVLKDNNFDGRFVDLFNKHRDELLKDATYKGMHGRYYSMYAWFAAMWDIYVELLYQCNVRVDFDFKAEIKSYIYAQNNRYDNNPVKMFIAGYYELYALNKIVIINDDSVNTLDFDVIQCVDKLFIRSKTVYNKVCMFWLSKGIDFPCSERKLRQLLYDANILNAQKEKLTVERKTTDNRSYSGYYLFQNTFKKFGGNNYGESNYE